MRIVFRRRLAPRLLRLDRFDETTSYSEVAALLAEVRGAGVEAHAHPDRAGGKRISGLGCRGQRTGRGREGHEEGAQTVPSQEAERLRHRSFHARTEVLRTP